MPSRHKSLPAKHEAVSSNFSATTSAPKLRFLTPNDASMCGLRYTVCGVCKHLTQSTQKHRDRKEGEEGHAGKAELLGQPTLREDKLLYMFLGCEGMCDGETFAFQMVTKRFQSLFGMRDKLKSIVGLNPITLQNIS